MRGRLRLRRRRVDLGRIDQSLLVVTAGADHIAPPHGTKPLLDLVSSEDVTSIDRPGGHIGLMAGSKARSEIWPDIARVARAAIANQRGKEQSRWQPTELSDQRRHRRREAQGARRVRHRRHPRDRRGDLPQPRQPGRDASPPATVATRSAPRSFKRELEQLGVNASIHQGNVGSADDCARTVGEVIDAHGRLDILVNNAGITVDKPVLKMAEDDWYKVLAVNLSGAFFMSQAALGHMLERGSGRIVNISSIVGQIGNIGQTNYAASKSGMFGLTMTLAREAAFNLKKAGKLDAGRRSASPSTRWRRDTSRPRCSTRSPRRCCDRIMRADSRRPARPPRGGRESRALPLRRRLVLYHRPGVGRQRRAQEM